MSCNPRWGWDTGNSESDWNGVHSAYFTSDLVYFQDYEENMERHAHNKKWKQWNLESTARILEKRFPYSFVWVVRPSWHHLNTFACYQNFVEANMFGVPDHRNHEYGALKHLRALLENAVKQGKCPN